MIVQKNKESARDGKTGPESSYRREMVAVAYGIFWLYCALAVVSYNPQDQTLFYFSSKGQALTNWAGWLGAHLAGFMFYLLGNAAYVVLGVLAYPLYLLLRNWPVRAQWRRLCVLSGGVVLVATLSSLYDVDMFRGIAGGLVGALTQQWCVLAIGRLGSQIVLWGVGWMACSYCLQVPMIPFFSGWVTWLWQQCVLGVQTCISSLRYVKNRIVAKLSRSSGTGVAGGALKVDLFDEAAWQTVTVEPVQGAEQVSVVVEQPVVPSVEQQVRLQKCPLRRTSVHTKIFQTPVAKIPNTVLHKHLFGDTNELFNEVMRNNRVQTPREFMLPPATLLAAPSETLKEKESQAQLTQRAEKLQEKLHHFGINGTVAAIKQGPVVTMFEYKPDIDSKISKILALEDDLAMALAAQSMRIVAPIPGRNVIGFEIANELRKSVALSHIIASDDFAKKTVQLPITLGVDSEGVPLVVDLASMPHLLIGGSTGSGKSVGLNGMLLSLLYALRPDQVKMILIDPKRLEFTPYADIPHLLFPIITQPAQAAAALAWVVQEMEERYAVMASAGARSIQDYVKSPENSKRPMPYLVIMIDELADLMMVAGKEVETHIVRIAQMARAAGIHMIVATQRPSVEVVTGMIKINFPSRVAYRVSSKVDSRTILDTQGAERLLGKGDLLFMHASSPDLRRVHGAYVSDADIEQVTEFLRQQGAPQYLDINEVLIRNTRMQAEDLHDELYAEVLEFIKTMDEISISMIQRHYRIGFNRSARLIEKLELDGLIAPAQGSKPRRVLH